MADDSDVIEINLTEAESLYRALANADPPGEDEDKLHPLPVFLQRIEFAIRRHFSLAVNVHYYIRPFSYTNWWYSYLKLATLPGFLQGNSSVESHNHRHWPDAYCCPTLDCRPNMRQITKRELRHIGMMLRKAGLEEEGQPKGENKKSWEKYLTPIPKGRRAIRFVPKTSITAPPPEWVPSPEDGKELKKRWKDDGKEFGPLEADDGKSTEGDGEHVEAESSQDASQNTEMPKWPMFQ
ncbi:MAG: hypothetical protein Q9162_000896 [Coniocarpon cinnabarinum]